jgi:aryl-alcohol dehydrogenase-like predicted oxidoreductase
MPSMPLAIAGSEVSISRIGFGCARIFGGRELKASARLIEAALAAGIRHFDTAPSYGDGQSEDVLGAVLAGVPGVTIATKIGIPRPGDLMRPHPARVLYRTTVRPVLSRFPAAKTRLLEWMGRRADLVARSRHPLRRRMHRDEVLRGLEQSLKRLRRDRTDLYLIHEPDQFELEDDLRELFLDFQRRGIVGAFGLAWDRIADSRTAFGTVNQGRYDVGLPGQGASGETRIFHGVLRYRQRSSMERVATNACGDRIREVLAAHLDAAVIFSASTPHQIRDIMVLSPQ